MVFQNDGFHFTKRRVYFLRGFHTPLFFALGSDSAPGSEFALGFESVLLFVLSRCFCSFRFCFSLVFAAFSLISSFSLHFFCVDSFFLILFGGFDFVRTFAAKNDGTITCRLERVQASVVTAFFFLLYKLHVILRLSFCI